MTGRPPLPATAAGAAATPAGGRIVDPRGRAKVYRPLPARERAAAVDRGLAAYARGDFYLAHEELEPAWMAADDSGERERLAGLIKLAAAFVHAARGNPAGLTTNLRGARERLLRAEAAGADGGLDLAALLLAIDTLLARVAVLPAGPSAVAETPAGAGGVARTLPDPPHDVAGPPGRARRPPLPLQPPTIWWRARA